MDIGELLAFKPEQTPKRPNEDEDDDPENVPSSSGAVPRKIRRMDGSSGMLSKQQLAALRPPQPGEESQLSEEERLAVLQYVENETAEGDTLDEAGLKKLLLLFEKRVLKNQEMRIKFPENPEKFMESEMELHDIIQQLQAVSTVPDLYPMIIQLNAVPSLLELLSHQNSDISVAILNLLQEMTDVDILHESQEGASALIEALRKQQACALLVQNLERLDESVKEEADGVHNTLAIVENLTEMEQAFTREAAEQGLLQWLLKRLKLKAPFDGNKLYCSEILSILLQSTTENRLLLGALEGIDVLLQQLATYKRHDPSTAEEQELMENLFNCICSALMCAENRERFLRGEGLQLMVLMMREKKLSRNGSLRVLDYAMQGVEGRDNCNKFVDILGLRTIFPLFMKTPKRNKKRLLSSDEHEEHVASILVSMLRNCKGMQKQRLMSKFVEGNLAKVDRLLELHLKYLEKVDQVDREIEETRHNNADEDEEEDEEDIADANYLKRLSGGLFVLQLVDYIILEVSASSEPIKQRVIQILNMRSSSMKTIRNVMREYAGNLGDAGDKEWRDQEAAHIIQLVDRF